MWLVGALLSVVGSIMLSAGMGAMKAGYAWQKALAQMDRDYGDRPRPIYRVRSWQTGAALYMAGNFLQFLSYAFAAQSLLLALSSVQFATHLLFAWLVARVQVSARSMMGAAVIVLSNLLLVVFSSKSSALLTAKELVKLYSAPAYIGYQVIAALLCMTCWLTYYLLHNGTLGKLQERHPAIAPVLLALGASLPGTQTLILTKAVSMMFVVSVGRQSQFTHWYFWIAAVTPVASASTWTAAMQHGLGNYPTVVIVPLLQVMYTAVGVLCGVLFFQEYWQMSTVSVVMYVVGFLGMFSGICLSISPDALAAGLQEMRDRAALPASDQGSCDSVSSDERGHGPLTRRATLLTQSRVQSGMRTARSTVHGAALASFGLGQQPELRCASIFVSPMALSPAILDQSEDDTRVAAAAQRRITVVRKLDEPRRPAPALTTVSEESDRDDPIAPDQGCRGDPETRYAKGNGGMGAAGGHRGKTARHTPKHPDRRWTGKHHHGPSPDHSNAACKPAISQLDLVSQGASDMACGSGDFSTGPSGDATQLSTIRVLPASAGIRQAARSVSQIELLSSPSPPSPRNTVTGSTGLHPTEAAQYSLVSPQAVQRSIGHTNDFYTNMTFSAELWSSLQKQQQGGPPIDARKFDNPLAHELQSQLRQAIPSGESAALAPKHMHVGMESVLAGAGQGRGTAPNCHHQNVPTPATDEPQRQLGEPQQTNSWVTPAPGQQMVLLAGQPMHSSGAMPSPHGWAQAPTRPPSQVDGGLLKNRYQCTAKSCLNMDPARTDTARAMEAGATAMSSNGVLSAAAAVYGVMHLPVRRPAVGASLIAPTKHS